MHHRAVAAVQLGLGLACGRHPLDARIGVDVQHGRAVVGGQIGAPEVARHVTLSRLPAVVDVVEQQVDLAVALFVVEIAKGAVHQGILGIELVRNGLRVARVDLVKRVIAADRRRPNVAVAADGKQLEAEVAGAARRAVAGVDVEGARGAYGVGGAGGQAHFGVRLVIGFKVLIHIHGIRFVSIRDRFRSAHGLLIRGRHRGLDKTRQRSRGVARRGGGPAVVDDHIVACVAACRVGVDDHAAVYAACRRKIDLVARSCACQARKLCGQQHDGQRQCQNKAEYFSDPLLHVHIPL